MRHDPLFPVPDDRFEQASAKPPRQRVGGRQILSDLTFLVLAAILGPVMVYLDATVLFDNMSEESLTEAFQALLVGGSALLFFAGAIKLPKARVYLTIAGLFLASMFVRENDVYLDQIRHGFWALPVVIMLGLAAFYGVRNRHRLKKPLYQHAATRQWAYLMVGLIIVLVFSRLFGSGDLWRAVMGESYQWQFKAALQEGIELMGYMILGYGALLSYLNRFGQPFR